MTEMRMTLISTICTTLLLLSVGSVWGADPVNPPGANSPGANPTGPESVAANRVAEFKFTSTKNYTDPFNQVDVDVVFTTPSGKELRVPAFWAGGLTWRVRYASPEVGEHQFKTVCSDPSNAELNGGKGAIKITPAVGDNPLYLHGPIRVAADKRHFEYADGTPFFWLGDTWWMGLCHRLHWPEEVKTLAADRKEKGFTVIQLVAGLYPDMHPFDPRGANEAGFPWEAEYARIRPEYFDAADQRIQYLADQGLSPCIVGAWGYFMPWMGVEKTQKHWRNLIARYGALPVTWCAAGEANLPWYLAKGFPYDDRKQVTDWTEVMRYIRATDPYRRPLTIHPTGLGRLSARHATDDVALLDFDMLQTPHGQRDAVEPTVRTMQESFADKPIMPVIDGEASYEMLGDSIPAQWTRQMFWLCMMNGAAGHTYGANGIWQCNRRGQPHGPSPHHAPGSVGYGVIPWDDAMKLPGSGQVGMGKKLLEKYPWYQFQPHPEWAEYQSDDASQKPVWNQWIWFPEGDPAASAPAEKRYFRKVFDLPEGKNPAQAKLWMAADDRCVAYINGKRVGEHLTWSSPEAIDVTAALRPGRNVLAIEAENMPAPVPANPAGLLCSMRVQVEGKEIAIASDGSWRSAKDIKDAAAQWADAEFKDENWSPAKELGSYGRAPWGRFQSGAPNGPYATGIVNQVRVIYVPDPHPVRVRAMEKDSSWQADYFDPITGKTTVLPAPVVDADGNARIDVPAGAQDWVIVLKRQQP